jgi:hypothetical protein
MCIGNARIADWLLSNPASFLRARNVTELPTGGERRRQRGMIMKAMNG